MMTLPCSKRLAPSALLLFGLAAAAAAENRTCGGGGGGGCSVAEDDAAALLQHKGLAAAASQQAVQLAEFPDCSSAVPQCKTGCGWKGPDPCFLFNAQGENILCSDKVNNCCNRCYLWNHRSPKQQTEGKINYRVSGPLIIPDPPLTGVESISGDKGSTETPLKWDPLWTAARRYGKSWVGKYKIVPENPKEKYSWGQIGLHVNPAGSKPYLETFRTMNTMHLHYKPMNSLGRWFAKTMTGRLTKMACGNWLNFDSAGVATLAKEMKAQEEAMWKAKDPTVTYCPPEEKKKGPCPSGPWRYLSLAPCKQISVKYGDKTNPFSDVWNHATTTGKLGNLDSTLARKKNLQNIGISVLFVEQKDSCIKDGTGEILVASVECTLERVFLEFWAQAPPSK